MRQLSGRSVGRRRSRSRIEDVERQPQIALLSYSSWERRKGNKVVTELPDMMSESEGEGVHGKADVVRVVP